MYKVKNLCRTLLIPLITALLVSTLMIGVGKAPIIAEVYVDPEEVKDLQLQPGETFSISISIRYVIFLQTWSFQLSFDNTVLEVSNVAEGPFLKEAAVAAGVQTVFVRTINNVKGTVTGVCTFLPLSEPSKGATGSGVLATVTFNVIGKGRTDLNLTETELGTTVETGGTPPYRTEPIEHTAVNGVFTNVGDVVADFNYSPEKPLVGDSVTFDASGSYDPDPGGGIVSYEWDFDDGNVTTVADPVITHIYTAPSTYDVTLTVTDVESKTETFSQTLTVYAELHDVAVVSVTYVHPTGAGLPLYVGYEIDINVTVMNEGSETETFEVTVHYDNTTIGTRSVTDLAPDANTRLTFTWNTTGASPGTYNITAEAILVGDDDPTNNVGYKDIILDIRDVAITSITVSQTTVARGDLINITVVVENKGTLSENCAVKAYYSNATDYIRIDEKSITGLSSRANTTMTFTWNTTGASPGTYNISAELLFDGTVTKDFIGTVSIESAHVEPTPTDPILLYVAAVAAGVTTIIVLAIAIYFLRVRKRGSLTDAHSKSN